MNLMRRTITILTVLVVWFPIFAQLEIGKQNEQPVVPTWESYEFMKYGTIGASPYTGTVNYSIPLYTYKDKDFEFPISLEYATNGYRVNHSSGLLGHGWSLSCVGRITRTIKGIPDETWKRAVLFSQSGIRYYGYSFLMDTTDYYPIVLYNRNGQVYTAKSDGYNYYETEADEYSFDFCGYSGSFQRAYNNTGQGFIIYGASGESKGLKIQTEGSAYSSVPESFIITDLNGYKYIFLRDEYIKTPDEEDVTGTSFNRVTLSWNLSTITAPNGRQISIFTTPHGSEDAVSGAKEIMYSPKRSHYFMTYAYTQIGESSDEFEIIQQKVYGNDLRSINFGNNVRVVFQRSKGKEEWGYTGKNSIHKSQTDSSRLDKIIIISNNDTVKVCKFEYLTNIPAANSMDGNCVSFLKSVNISGEGRYEFEYNGQHSWFPFLGTSEYDHWGYFNGKNNGFSNVSFRNVLNYDNYYDESISGLMKNPSFNSALSGTLSKINYPTGGFSTIEYEPHDYSRLVARRSYYSGETPSSPFFQPKLELLSSNNLTGGVRIKRIITHLSSDNPSDTISYEYRLSEEDSLSSGILIGYPRYGIKYTSTDGYKHVEYYNVSNSLHDYGRTHIEYSRVKKTQSGKGSIVYDYSTSSEFIDKEWEDPDPYVLPVYTFKMDVGGQPWLQLASCDKRVEMALTPIPSYQTKRGKLLKESFFDNNGTLLQEKNNYYDYPLASVDSIIYVAGEVAKSVCTPRFNCDLTGQMTTDYSNGMAVTKTENYTYNNLGLPTSVTTNASDGSSLRTNLYYVCDSMSNSGVIADMAESHNLAQLLKKEQYKITNSNEKLVSAERLEYYHPDENNLALACPIAKYSWLNGQQWKLVESYQYDDKGNLIERTDTRGISESYLWGYKGCYPVARVNNSSFDDLNQLLNNSANTIRDTATLSDNKFIELKNLGSQQPNSLYSLYRYRTGVGLTEVVKPNLSTTTYQYNGYGKLTEIRDNGGHLIEQYDYNIITVEPLSASLECDTACYINRELTAVIACNGGSGLYSYRWAIIKANGDTSVVDSGTSIVLSPLDILIPSGQYCIIECTVHDIVSGESLTLTQSVYIKPSILCFENIEEIANLSNSSAIVTALIYSDNSVLACFCLERKGSTNCSVSIGNSSYSNFVNKTTDFFMQLYPGWNNVTLAVVNAVTADVELSIVSAEGHEIGQPNNISIQY